MGGATRGGGPPGWFAAVRAALGGLEGRGLVVAVSGGSDSVGLLRALHAIGGAAGVALSVAHLDHGVRGAEAEADARFVAELATGLGLPFDLGRWRPGRPAHFEADARAARYAWLAEVAAARGAAAVAVGQTRDDQAETILHRVVRGTGLRGLAGIPARRPLAAGVALIRPLLAVSRAEVRAYLAAIGQGYREDETNRDTARTRARLRHDLLPKLAADYNPRVVEALVRLGAHARAADRSWRRALARRARRAIATADPGRIVVRCAALKGLEPAEVAEVLRLAWRRAGWPERAMDAARWGRLADLVRRGGRLSLGGGIDAAVSDGRLLLVPSRPAGCD